MTTNQDGPFVDKRSIYGQALMVIVFCAANYKIQRLIHKFIQSGNNACKFI